MALRAGLPGRLIPVRFMLPASRKNKSYQQRVLLHHAEMVAFLTHDIPVARELPCGICLFHEMAAAAEIRVLLDIVVVPDRKHDAQQRNDKHEGNNNDLFPLAEASFELVEYF